VDSALFIRGGALGDFILTLPAIRAFCSAYPAARVEILGYPHIAVLAEKRGYAAAVRPIDQRGMAGFFAEGGDLDPVLVSYLGSFDLVVSFLYDPDTVFQRNLRRAGATGLLAAEGRPGAGAHASEQLAAWLPKAGVRAAIEAPRLFPSEADAAEAAAAHPPAGAARVVLHLGSGSPSKNWPARRFAGLAARLAGKGFEVLAVDGPADEPARKEFWASPLPPGVRRCSGLKLNVLAALLSRCAAFVGHDSGISHLAAAAGAPVCAIFGPTDARVWRPRGERVVVLQRGASPSAVGEEEVERAVLGLVGPA
jgi:heptosyltransferase-2